MKLNLERLTPHQIVRELDRYIIGQNAAKKNIAIALRNRWRRLNSIEEMQQEIVPNNILMIGSTGVGKTEIARRIAKIVQAPFVKVEASKFTEVGYVGRDVESMVRDLVEHSIRLVRNEKKEIHKEKVKESVENMILDALLPPSKPSDMVDASNKELMEKTRGLFRKKLKNKEIEDRKIEISITHAPPSNIGMIGGGMIDETSLSNIQDALSNMFPKRQKKKKLTIKEARQVLTEAEFLKLIEIDDIKEEAISKAENSGIIFIDEIDKIASKSDKSRGSAEVSREGVQRDLLPIVEGSTVNTKYGIVKTDHILFVASGAFHIAKPSDLIPELQGRFPIRVELNNLTKKDFVRILKEPKNAIIKQYQALLNAEKVSLSFNEDAIDVIAEKAFQLNEEVENIGARRLQTVLSYLLNDFMFDIPDKIGINANITVTKEMTETKLNNLHKNQPSTQYIL